MSKMARTKLDTGTGDGDPLAGGGRRRPPLTTATIDDGTHRPSRGAGMTTEGAAHADAGTILPRLHHRHHHQRHRQTTSPSSARFPAARREAVQAIAFPWSPNAPAVRP